MQNIHMAHITEEEELGSGARTRDTPKAVDSLKLICIWNTEVIMAWPEVVEVLYPQYWHSTAASHSSCTVKSFYGAFLGVQKASF